MIYNLLHRNGRTSTVSAEDISIVVSHVHSQYYGRFLQNHSLVQPNNTPTQ